MSKAQAMIDGLGGADNIEEIEGCITRLRTDVKDISLVDDKALKAAGATAVVRAGGSVQVIVGTIADSLAEDINDLLP
ncbi:glucose PTS transporter subunit EIIB [Frigoribacterium sp. PvP032]|uniref:glucose PTS transporter subunit EIIB n=1 Tax=Frigoribacterium sp. PvP032 TaxID=2806589 RepID=UPI001AEB7EC8|nr:PTS glucose/sucrose transporter subunit IIB [Frigoribacterium sp. PvP032]MBP1191817.1 PTS system N-acetylglucosamine-specific IIB component [Frigoribacterium sp. PvP032]